MVSYGSVVAFIMSIGFGIVNLILTGTALTLWVRLRAAEEAGWLEAVLVRLVGLNLGAGAEWVSALGWGGSGLMDQAGSQRGCGAMVKRFVIVELY